MFRTIADRIPQDNDMPERAWVLDVRNRVLEGSLYDVLDYPFHQERSGFGEYIPLRDRRPSVRYGLCRIVVEDSVSMLFSEGHFPAVDCLDEPTRVALLALMKETRLNEVMLDAAQRGSVGSVAILMRILNGRVFFQVMPTGNLTPSWKADAPDRLVMVRERYKVKGAVLASQGYDIAPQDGGRDFWFQRDWTESEECWYLPWPVIGNKGEEPQRDDSRSTLHNLGFVPMVWVRNLPGGDAIDGACTFVAAIDSQIEIDYQLSQAGRGLKYSSDPTLVIKEPSAIGMGATVVGQSGGAGGPAIMKGGDNVILLSEAGEAKMLEISGAAAQAVIDYVRTLRELALETVHGNRSSADKLSAAQSGRAMELMNQGLIWLADRLRVSYGEGALLALLRMVVQASAKREILINGQVAQLDSKASISLKWSPWYAPTSDDRNADASTLSTLVKNGLLSRESAVKDLAGTYDIEDTTAELARIQATEMAASSGSAGQKP